LFVTIELTGLTNSDEWAASVAFIWAEAPCRTQCRCCLIRAISKWKLFTPALAWDAGPVYDA
jgi:hypothetical protein